ncbi:hypothetical protein [Hyphomonas sp.]|uniref:hypothetical protein n=1 Tax=Hyphomonas sp. TaxID=87 RepID=UPI0037BFAEF1
MITLSNSCVALLERCLAIRKEQEFGFRFQDAVAVALHSLDEYRGCYSNPGAGQPDIIAGSTGFEVKSTGSDAVGLDGNYHAIRGQYPHFRLVGLRTDVKPYPLWVIRMPENPPTRVRFARVLEAGLVSDADIEARLGRALAEILCAAGTGWSDEPDRALGKSRLESMRASLAQVR